MVEKLPKAERERERKRQFCSTSTELVQDLDSPPPLPLEQFIKTAYVEVIVVSPSERTFITENLHRPHAKAVSTLSTFGGLLRLIQL